MLDNGLVYRQRLQAQAEEKIETFGVSRSASGHSCLNPSRHRPG